MWLLACAFLADQIQAGLAEVGDWGVWVDGALIGHPQRYITIIIIAIIDFGNKSRIFDDGK